eukprot:SM000132S26915  [mRNA]  locus=s132:303816:308600:- [translate_table: standard]
MAAPPSAAGAAAASATETPPPPPPTPPSEELPAAEAAPQAAAVAAAAPGALITEGSTVLVDVNGERQSFVTVRRGGKLRVGKASCDLVELVGCPFGATFELCTADSNRDGRAHLVKLDGSSGSNEAPKGAGVSAAANADMQDKDNRSLSDTNTAQALTEDDILRMRREGTTGGEIVQALVENSATFNAKTEYSQEKYRVRKQKKYAPRVTVRRPTANSLCAAYFLKAPSKTGFLRVDSLALLLNLANVGAHAEVLVVDGCGGLLTAAVAERLGGFGSVCSAYWGTRPASIDIVRLFNLDPCSASCIIRTSIAELIAARQSAALDPKVGQQAAVPMASPSAPGRCNEDSMAAGTEQGERAAIEEMPIEAVADEGGRLPAVPVAHGEAVLQMSASTVAGAAPAVQEENSEEDRSESHRLAHEVAEAASGSARSELQAGKAGKAGRRAPPEQLQWWAQRGFTSLIVAAPSLQPLAIVEPLLLLLQLSGPFAIYHTHLQKPLADCMHWLQSSKHAVALQLAEPWLREYQILPARSHPHMLMSGSGGYVLSGIRVAPRSGAEKAAGQAWAAREASEAGLGSASPATDDNRLVSKRLRQS